MQPLFSMHSPLPAQRHRLRLLEPPESSQNVLWERLFTRAYNKPFIVESGSHRRLQFDLHTVQSAMHLEHPDRLLLAYTRKMMTFLLFNREPARILMLGLGGGSLAKFCYRRLGKSAVTVAEVNPDVIALREEFCIPADDNRFRVLCTNAADYVAGRGRSKDVILADACDREGIAPELNSMGFYQNVHRRLSGGGVFIVNLCGDTNHWPAHMDKIRSVFGNELMTLQVRPDGNVIVLAFKDRHPGVDWQRLVLTSFQLKRSLGLNFPRYLRRIALGWKLQRWEPLSGANNRPPQ